VNALGLYDLDRNIRNVGKAYRKLISDWTSVLPTQSVCLQVPIVMPSEFEHGWSRERRRNATEARRANHSGSHSTDAPKNAD
jgi:beta-glucosidase